MWPSVPRRAGARIGRGAATLLVALGLQACTQWQYELGTAAPAGYEDRAAGLSLAQVLADLGPPLRFVGNERWLYMAWESWRIRESSIGLSLGFVGADLLEFDWGDARIQGDYLVLGFDPSRTVSLAFRARRDDDIADGAAIQPLSGLLAVVDVDDLLGPLPAHGWGAAQLQRLPEPLNNSQRPGMGDSAMEQRGTPGGAGQRSQGWPD